MDRILPIVDFAAPELDVYARLSENQLVNRENPDEGLFIAESPKVIERALDGGYAPVSFLMQTQHTQTQGRALLERCPDIPCYTAELDVLKQLTGFPLTRGMLCAMRRPPAQDAALLLREKRRIAVLEGVVNPTNVGAIFRSAAALGMDAVVLTHDCSDPLYRRAIRVSMGTVFQIPWAYLPPQPLWTDFLHRQGFLTVAMALREDSLTLRDRRLARAERLAVALGAEGDGLTDATIASCDYTVRIPMLHGVDSLNVAAASAVAFYALGSGQEE